MTARDDAAMGALAGSLIWPAADLIRLVHGGGDREAIGELLSALSGQERWAMLVVLAGMADPGKTPDESLGWITWDEHGRPLTVPRVVGPRWRVRLDHGTPGMFDRHLALGEDPCRACEDANTARLEGRRASNSHSARRVRQRAAESTGEAA